MHLPPPVKVQEFPMQTSIMTQYCHLVIVYKRSHGVIKFVL